jgi:hypothetical protein
VRFNFSSFNHCSQGQIIIEDITVTMGHQMRALGHQASWTTAADFISRDVGYNVILESFADDPNTVASITKAHSDGCRFLYVATEEPSEKGFNSGLDPAMIDRQNAFPAAARFCDGILHLIPGDHVTKWYSQFAPAAYAETGFAPTMVEEDDIEPEVDFGFYGKMTWRREEILGRLEQMTGAPVLRLTSFWTPRLDRDAAMRRCRVILQIRANLETQWVSGTRCAAALHFGRPIVAEPHDIKGPWGDVVPFSASVESFYADAIKTAGNWRGIHTEQMARFRERLTPERCVGQALRQIGVC